MHIVYSYLSLDRYVFLFQNQKVFSHHIAILQEYRLIYVLREIFHERFNTGNTYVTKQEMSSSLLKMQILLTVIISLKKKKEKRL